MKKKDVYKIIVVVFGILFVVWGLVQYSAYHGENNTSGYGSSVYSTPWQGATPGSVCYVHVKADKDVRVQIFSTADMRTETKEVTHASYGGLFDSSYETTSARDVYINESDYGTWVPITNSSSSTYTTYETKQIPVAEKTGKDVTLITITGKTTTFFVNAENPDENSGESIKYTLDMVAWAPNYLLILIGIVFISSVFIYSWIKTEPVIPKIKKYYPAHETEKGVEIIMPKTIYIFPSKLKDKQEYM